MTDMTDTGTCETMPCHHWVSRVVDVAGCSVEEMEHHATRERLHRWFVAGEPVWMAADALRTFVRNGIREERADREVNAMHAAIKIKGL